MEETIKEINDLADGDAGALVQKLKRRLERFDNEEAEKKDSRMLFRMAAANVGHDEPEFRRRRGERCCFFNKLIDTGIRVLYKSIHIDLLLAAFLFLSVRLIKNMFASIRDKVRFGGNGGTGIRHDHSPMFLLPFFNWQAHYSVKDCCDVRIYPDHTQLLYENEAFLASLSENATEVVAMRVSPSINPFSTS